MIQRDYLGIRRAYPTIRPDHRPDRGEESIPRMRETARIARSIRRGE